LIKKICLMTLRGRGLAEIIASHSVTLVSMLQL
jgi:hypothetical protein